MLIVNISNKKSVVTTRSDHIRINDDYSQLKRRVCSTICGVSLDGSLFNFVERSEMAYVYRLSKHILILKYV